MTETAFDPTPPRLGVAATFAVGLFAVAATGLAQPAGPLAAIGVVVATAGVARGSRRLLAIGTATTFAGLVLGALAGLPPTFGLVGAGAALLLWDVGEHAIGLGEQVGRRADSRRALLVHLGASAAAVLGVIVVAIGVFRLARRGQPGAAGVVLAGAAVLLAIVLDW